MPEHRQPAVQHDSPAGKSLLPRAAPVADVLAICERIGEVFRHMPADHRELAIAHLLNRARRGRDQDDPLAAQMFAAVADGCSRPR